MAAMNMVSAGWFSGVSFYLTRCPQGVASALRKKTPILESRRSKLDNLTVVYLEIRRRGHTDTDGHNAQHSDGWHCSPEKVPRRLPIDTRQRSRR